jgi:intracellular multiplication protein IcmL
MKHTDNKLSFKIICLSVIMLISSFSTALAASSSDGKGAKLSSLNISQSQVVYWAGSSLVKILSMNYMSLREDFASSSKLFTVPAWAAFSKSLKTSGIIDKLQQDKLGMRAIPTDVAMIKSQGNVGGNYSWTINIPVLLVMANKSERITHKWSVDLVIERSPAYIGMDGLAIKEFVAKPVDHASSAKKKK